MQVIRNPQDIQLSQILGLDIETTGLKPWEDHITLVQIATSTHIYLIDPSEYSHAFMLGLFEHLAKCKVVIAHNAKFECGFIYAGYGVLHHNMWCTMLASQILTNGKTGIDDHRLPAVVWRYLHKELEFAEDKSYLQKSFTSRYALDSFSERQLRYAADDVKYLDELYKKEHQLILESKLHKIIELENTLIPVLAKMEVEGCLIDKDRWYEVIKSKWEPRLHEIEKLLDEEAGRLAGQEVRRNKHTIVSYDLFGFHTEQVICSPKAINYASSEQLLDFISSLQEPIPTFLDGKTKQSKPSVDDPSLVKYLNDYPTTRLRRFIGILRDYREQYKLISTYGEKFLGMLDSENKIHTLYTQAYTKTGRLSSKSPNLQNIPAPDKKRPDHDVRRFFIARPGYRLITCDMASAEIAIAADYSGEPLILDSILKGTDMHSDLASTTFSLITGNICVISNNESPVKIGEQTYAASALRQAHKTVIFAKFYKAGARRVYSCLAEYINPLYEGGDRLAVAQRISKAIDERMPKLNAYLTSLINQAHRDGYLRTSSLGRIRYFDDSSYGECANAPIQGTNAEAIKIAMVRLFRFFDGNSIYGARIVGNIHDEVIIECLAEHAEEVAEIVKKIVGESLGYFLKTVQGKASVKINTHWEK